MYMNKKVSIIIPVYNNENTIVRCLDSVINQTYKNIEIIVINDGSTDNSKRIVEKYIDKIIFIDNSNHGVSFSRNIGLSKSTGEYITFLDADDWLEEYMIEKLVKCKENNKVDIIRFNYYIDTFEKNKNSKNIMCVEENIKNIRLTINCDIINYFITNKLEGYVWAIFFDRKIINKFDDSILIMEDFLFVIESLMKAKTIYFYDEALYHYCINNKSITKSVSNIHKKINDLILVGLSVQEIFENYNKIEINKFIENQTNLIYLFFLKMIKSKKRKDYKNDIKRVNYDNLTIFLKNVNRNSLGMQRKIGFILIKNKSYLLMKIYVFILEKLKKILV